MLTMQAMRHHLPSAPMAMKMWRKGNLLVVAGTETGTVIMTNSTEGIKTESYLISPLSHVCERSNEDQKR